MSCSDELLASDVESERRELDSLTRETSCGIMSDELLASDVESEHGVKDESHSAELEALETLFTGDRDVSSEHVREAKACSHVCWMQQHSANSKGFLQNMKVCCPAGRALFLLLLKTCWPFSR